LIQEEIKRRLNSGNVWLPFCPEPSVFAFPVMKVELRIYKTIILPVVLYGYATLSLTIRKEHRPRVFENRVLIEYLMNWAEGGENCITRSFMTCTLRQV
jgi:hypothetical protein